MTLDSVRRNDLICCVNDTQNEKYNEIHLKLNDNEINLLNKLFSNKYSELNEIKKSFSKIEEFNENKLIMRCIIKNNIVNLKIENRKVKNATMIINDII